MKSKITKVVAVACAVLAFGSIAGCKRDVLTSIDESKAQLRLLNFDGGVGTDWLKESVARFTELYKNKSFTPGTTGVQIHIDTSKSIDFTNIPNMDVDIMFAEHVNFYDVMADGHLLDITDMVTAPMTEFGETQSVEDKLYDNYKEYFKTSAGKYYGIPHYKGDYCITYDRALWDEKRLFVGEDGEVNQKANSSTLDVGPDGKKGTYDDGLPKTYEQFFEVCDVMSRKGIDPFVWSGAYQWYASGVLMSMKADVEGEHADVVYSFNEEVVDNLLIKEIKADGTVVYDDEPTTINVQNGYELFRSAGNYYPVKFMESIIENGYVAEESKGATSHTDAQESYLFSKYTSSTGKSNRIAMLMEGNWWGNEAKEDVQAMKNLYGETFNARNFAILPFPKATEAQVGEQQTMLDTGNTVACISKYTKVPELAKLFLQFLQTNDELVNFVKSTNLTRNYKFTVSDEDYENLNTFAKSMVDLHVSEDTNHVMAMSSSDFYYKNPEITRFQEYFNISGLPVTRVFWSTGADHKSAEQAFEIIKNRYTKAQWEVLASK